MAWVLVGVVDIGSNTVRLLVAARDGSAVRAVREERAVLALGEEVERLGRLTKPKLEETAAHVRRYARIAREHRCRSLEVIVTAPGRQSENGPALVRVLERAARAPVRVLPAVDEGRLAFFGAVGQARDDLPPRVAVCDVGGGSTEIAVGTPQGAVELCASVDVGSLRLTRRLLDGGASAKALGAARREVEERFDSLELPAADGALAAGGSARRLRRLLGKRRLRGDDIATAVEIAARRGPAGLAADLGLDPVRARTLLAGALILAEAQRRLDLPLEIARGGLREGAASVLLSEQVAA
jgi:exopolyphosphatase/guanosine-5'-triphosphate,3'-diphosphate pyrophosphatase